jgi:hypothetical protein
MALAVSLMAVAIPVFTVDRLGLAPWVPAAIFATVTITSAVFRVPVISAVVPANPAREPVSWPLSQSPCGASCSTSSPSYPAHGRRFYS